MGVAFGIALTEQMDTSFSDLISGGLAGGAQPITAGKADLDESPTSAFKKRRKKGLSHKKRDIEVARHGPSPMGGVGFCQISRRVDADVIYQNIDGTCLASQFLADASIADVTKEQGGLLGANCLKSSPRILRPLIVAAAVQDDAGPTARKMLGDTKPGALKRAADEGAAARKVDQGRRR